MITQPFLARPGPTDTIILFKFTGAEHFWPADPLDLKIKAGDPLAGNRNSSTCFSVHPTMSTRQTIH